jgi:hypothetical protein
MFVRAREVEEVGPWRQVLLQAVVVAEVEVGQRSHHHPFLEVEEVAAVVGR